MGRSFAVTTKVLLLLGGVIGSLGFSLPVQAAPEITPSTVYAQAVQIEKEVDLMRTHLKIKTQGTLKPVVADLQPRHAWQKAYLIMLKISQFRRKQGMSGFAPLSQEPELKTDPRTTWGQTQRVLAELRIVKTNLGIAGEVGPAARFEGKRPIDVFNKLNAISYDLDALIGEPTSPALVYAEARRINADINSLLRRTATADTAVPPARQADARPADSLMAAFALMEEIQRLQRHHGIETTDFGAFRKQEQVAPADVFNMVGMCIAEMQTLKAKLGLKHAITPPADYVAGKTPAEVQQLLLYEAAKLRLIQPQ